MEIEGLDTLRATVNVVGQAVAESANIIHNHARIGYLTSKVIAESDQEKDRAAAVRIASLVLFNSLAFHDRLALIEPDVPTVDEAWQRRIDGLLEAWSDICEHINYVPVFELGIKIIRILKYGFDDYHVAPMEPLLQVVKMTRDMDGHDLAGRLFHTLLTDAKFQGAYYTSVPAATLLCQLVFHEWPKGIDWYDHEFPSSLNVADLACGTGTLLMAVAAEVERKHREVDGKESANLHKHMVEQALHGYDVQLSAVHFAATGLAMLNPNIKFDHMKLYVMPIGVEDSNIKLGSLEFLGESEAAVQYRLGPPEMGYGLMDAHRVYSSGSRGAEDGETATLPSLDLTIMNPPFTRSGFGNLLFGSLPSSDRSKMQRELQRRLKSVNASATAGLGAAFVAAAAPKLRPGEGRLALVLPLTVCTGPSWAQTRALIEADYDLDMVVASHDPERWNFSDSTNLSEALLIATRRSDEPTYGAKRTKFVNLWRNPSSVYEATRMATVINQAVIPSVEEQGTALLEVDGQHVGEVF